ncbi:MAG: sodium-dependent bicarbonate transport family permease [Reyranella sp.]|nr:sodium-dependent bicarbonate transport family permease [Reyranella sp.]MBL6652599.1 sodium-dependent bicarbonate transport family permease [Reyranella sp.]
MTFLSLAHQNLLSPMVLFFALGVALAFARSDLSIPGAVAKLLSLYLMMSIGFRGGSELAHHGLSATLAAALAAGLALSFLTPFVAYLLLRLTTGLSIVDAAAVSAHYGSISAVTLVAVMGVLREMGLPFEGFMIAVAAVMETPAILSALLLARRQRETGHGTELAREILLNGAVVMLLGSFAIGAVTGERGSVILKPFLVDQFAGFLCLFLLDMGLVSGRGLRDGARVLSARTIAFALLMPLAGAAFASALAPFVGLSTGGTAILITLAASASYIAVPAAMRLALPAASPGLALALSLGVTFPFNLTLGIPLYVGLAQRLTA